MIFTQHTFDLRDIPVGDRAGVALEAADRLSAGEGIEFRTDLDPSALGARLEQLRPGVFTYEPRMVGTDEWRLVIAKVEFDGTADSLQRALQISPIFSRLSDDARLLIAESMTRKTLRRGDVVCSENSECSELGILLEGTLGVIAGGGTRDRLLYQIVPFDVFGEIEFFDGGLSLGRIAAISKTATICTIPYGKVRDMLAADPSFLMTLGARASQRARTIASALAAQVTKPIIARVAAALLPYAIPENGLQPSLMPLPTMTQLQIAAAAGTVKEVCARAIADLEENGALRRERGHIRYLDRARLLEVMQAPQ